MNLSYYLGRFVFGGFFLYSGIHHLIQRKAMAQYVGAKNVPMPDAAVNASGVALTLSGAVSALE
jgi:putative oxidoreductase